MIVSVPAGQVWQLYYAQATLDAGTVNTPPRTNDFIVDDGVNDVVRFPCTNEDLGNAHTSMRRVLGSNNSLASPQRTDTNTDGWGLNHHPIMLSGYRFRTITANLQSDDQWTDGFLWVSVTPVPPLPMKRVTFPDPAPGDELTIVVPAGVVWVVYFLLFTRTTGSVTGLGMGSRWFDLIVDDGTNELYRMPQATAKISQGPNLTWHLQYGVESTQSSAPFTGNFGSQWGSGAGAVGLPRFSAMFFPTLSGGYRISTFSHNLQPGDSYSNTILYVAEYL